MGSRSKKILLASGNQGKIREMRLLMADASLDVDVLGLSDLPAIEEPEEPYDTFEKNALHKASYYNSRSGLPTLADDSGLEVDALAGAPGVYSARFAGKPRSDARNNEKLLQELAAVPMDKRTARFRCVLAFTDGTDSHVFDGAVEGAIDAQCTGDGGFGYDVVFLPDGFDKSFGVLSPEIKKGISHRSRAFHKFVQWFLSAKP
jgi:XTP/dITP diphosphohydrolase